MALSYNFVVRQEKMHGQVFDLMIHSRASSCQKGPESQDTGRKGQLYYDHHGTTAYVRFMQNCTKYKEQEILQERTMA